MVWNISAAARRRRRHWVPGWPPCFPPAMWLPTGVVWAWAKLPSPGRLPLFHFDMYRLEDADSLFDIGWEDYLDRGGVCAVEWSEQTEDALPSNAIRFTIARCPEADTWRTITIEGATLP